jgi:hypothetical protein
MRAWTPVQDEYLRAWWGRVPTDRIAGLMDRGPREVAIRAWEIGITKYRPRGYLPPDWESAIRRLAAEGVSLTEIAAELGSDRHDIADLMAARGIEVDPGKWRDRQRQKIRRGVRRQLDRLGVRTAADLRTEAYRRFARRRGWPEDFAPRAVQICDALYELGPMTRREICDAIGVRWRAKNVLMHQGNSHLGVLAARGFVVRQIKVRVEMSRLVDLYMLDPFIKRGDPTTWPGKTATENATACRSDRSTNRNSRKN